MFPFSIGKKKKEKKKVYIPVDLVLRYSGQGLSEPDIIARLEAQGFPQHHIDKALRIALREKVISGAPPTPMATLEEPVPEVPSPMPFGEVPTGAPIEEHFEGPVLMGEARSPMPLGYPPERIIQRPPKAPQPITEQPEVRRAESLPPTEITVEEIIEAIVSERWRDFEERLSAFEKRDLQLQHQIEALRKEVDAIERVLEEKEKTMISKLEEFGGSIEGIQGRIGGIERVFKDFLPELTTNIKTMSSLVEKMKKEK
ncbi:MAG: hypothetical protein GTN40_04915 [Candidatus Aenigmarchaeota archaeon]|nr:hypothetical protein [Candidatus Aenigmarchaeota archaeon]